MTYDEKSHILIIDDDKRIRTLIYKYLWRQDFVALMAADAAEGAQILRDFHIDLVICDVMMPGQNGLEFTQSLRKDGIQVPLILLTALGEVEQRIEGLERGADDYLPKPFDPRELALRIKALLNRTQKISEYRSVHIGSYKVNLDQAILQSTGNEDGTIYLTDLEVKILNILIKNKNIPVSRESIAEFCSMTGTDRAIDVQITRLRKKIEPDPSQPRYLKTVRGKGYKLVVI